MKHDRYAADAARDAIIAAQGERIAQLEIAVLDLLGRLHAMQRGNREVFAPIIISGIQERADRIAEARR